MKAVILAGGWGSVFRHLGNNLEKIELPIANKNLIHYQLNFLRKFDISEVFICLSKENGISKQIALLDSESLKVHLVKDLYPKGTAGCLQPLKEELKKEPFVIMNGNLLVDFDLDRMIGAHCANRAKISLAVSPLWSRKPYGMEVVVTDTNRTLKEYKTDLLKESAYSHYIPHGVYVFDPEVLDLVPNHGYMDIKEQLIPDVRYQGGLVKAHTINGYCKPIFSVTDYYMANKDVLEGRVPGVKLSKEFRGWNHGIWVGNDVKIGAFVNLVGPVIIGDNSEIEKYAQIIGPTVIGGHCTIGRNSIVSGSILLENTKVAHNTEVQNCIVSKDCQISKKGHYQNTVLIQKNMQIGDINLLTPEYHFKDVLGLRLQSLMSRGLWLTHAAFKRAFDLSFALLLAILIAPIFLVISLLIWMTSGTPIFFVQKRCGKYGKEFSMIKFRTMVKEAEKLHVKLLAKNEVDGPMFKLKNDPRLTSFGKFLRKISLDELPQLVNVIRGDMSLVGPRPLAVKEMKFCNRWEDMRLRVKPGLTGLWQVNSRNSGKFHTWIDQDIYYIKNQSPWLDTKILFQTFRKFLSQAGS
jgi:lipopolysaccharide/colanic/teichoic acid biosynthesis glycosyltransferase/NDP-sugar pyrophosphorylase family protein